MLVSAPVTPSLYHYIGIRFSFKMFKCFISYDLLTIALRYQPELIFRNLYFDSVPLAPKYTKPWIHKKLVNINTFGAHVLDGWYIRPLLQHYRSNICIVSSTAGLWFFFIKDTFHYCDYRHLSTLESDRFTSITTAYQAHKAYIHIL